MLSDQGVNLRFIAKKNIREEESLKNPVYMGIGIVNNYLTAKSVAYTEGATSDAPGCLECCTKIQTGYKCSFGQECWPRCGDGVLDTGTLWGNVAEKCDDGNIVSGDGCQSDCGLIEEGYE